MKPEIIINNDNIEVIGHYDDETLCAKMTLLADLYAIEHRDGYAKFNLDIKDKLGLIDKDLLFSVSASLYVDGTCVSSRGADWYMISVYANGFSASNTIYAQDIPNYKQKSTYSGTYTYTGSGIFKGLTINGTFYGEGQKYTGYKVSTVSATTVLMPSKTIDLSTMSGWSELSSGNHTVKLKSSASDYRDSSFSSSVTITK